ADFCGFSATASARGPIRKSNHESVATIPGNFIAQTCLTALYAAGFFPGLAMERHKLDSIDMRILAELQKHGRITNVELSRRAKITAPPCLRRMRALEKAGYIKGYHADLNAKALGFSVTGFVFVGLGGQKDADLKHFEDRVRSWPQ